MLSLPLTSKAQPEENSPPVPGEAWAAAELSFILSCLSSTTVLTPSSGELSLPQPQAQPQHSLSPAASCAETQPYPHLSALCWLQAQAARLRNTDEKCPCRFLSLTAAPQPASS